MAKSKSKVHNLLNIKQVKDVNDLKRRALTITFYGAASFLGYKFVLQPMLQKYRKKHEQQSILTDSNKQQATFFYNAMNPSGISWMRAIDFTNEDMIYAAARKVTDWNAVQQTYSNLYSRNLLSDLQSELSSREYKTFMNILSFGKANRDKHNTNRSRRGKVIASSKAIRLRSTPDSSYKSYSFNSNIYGVIPANTFLGWATGQVKVDDYGVKYIQVGLQFNGTIHNSIFRNIIRKQGRKNIRFWVGSGAIYQFDNLKQAANAGIQIPKSVSNNSLVKSIV